MREITRTEAANTMYDAIVRRMGTPEKAGGYDALKVGIQNGLTEISMAMQNVGPEAVTMLAVKRKRGWFKRAFKKAPMREHRRPASKTTH